MRAESTGCWTDLVFFAYFVIFAVPNSSAVNRKVRQARKEIPNSAKDHRTLRECARVSGAESSVELRGKKPRTRHQKSFATLALRRSRRKDEPRARLACHR